MSARRILLVDDDPDIRQLAALSLRRIGQFHVELAASGAEAIEMASRDPPDLVLLDVSMPGMDGPATLEGLRRIPAISRIPVVFFTATSSDIGPIAALSIERTTCGSAIGARREEPDGNE